MSETTASQIDSSANPRRALTLFDSTCLIVGIIIGVGIYQMAPDVARGVGGPWTVLGIWLLGGLISLTGAMCYAELATAYPEEGGDYVYLSRAYGPWAGFLFGWAQLLIVRPGDIVIMAFAFATYARAAFDPLAANGFTWTEPLYALGAVAVLTAINIFGVKEGKTTQNILTSIKALGLLFIILIGFTSDSATSPRLTEDIPWNLALIFVLFTYGGWNEMAYVAAEVKDSRRNITRALMLGTFVVAILYIAINGAFLSALGYEGLRASKAVAADTIDAMLPGAGGRTISVLVCLSALGAINGLIFAGARISFAMGRDHKLFRRLGQWQFKRGSPTQALLLQGAISVVLIVALGSFANALLYTSAAVYSFYLATTLSVIVLRRRDPGRERPFRVPGYPFTPIFFAATCAFLVYSAVIYKPFVAVAAVALVITGYFVFRFSAPRTNDLPIRDPRSD